MDKHQVRQQIRHAMYIYVQYCYLYLAQLSYKHVNAFTKMSP